MSHFAKVNKDNVVTNVIVAEQDFVDTLDGTWIQTSYNTHGGKHYDPETTEEDDGTPLRKNFACIGFTYDPVRDAFIPPKQFSSHVFNEDTCMWEPPTPYPELADDDTGYYLWLEEAYESNGDGWVYMNEDI